MFATGSSSFDERAIFEGEKEKVRKRARMYVCMYVPAQVRKSNRERTRGGETVRVIKRKRVEGSEGE